MKHDKNENDYLNAEKMYATKLHNALKANDITSVKSLGQEIIRALPYTYRDIFDEVIRDTDSELAKKLQPIDYVAFMHDLEEGSEPMLQVKDVDDHYNGSFVDAGVLSGMLTDAPEIRKATVNWMKGLTGKDLDELKKIVSSQTFKDMYGEPDWEGNTKVGSIAKSITQNDLGRSL